MTLLDTIYQGRFALPRFLAAESEESRDVWHQFATIVHTTAPELRPVVVDLNDMAETLVALGIRPVDLRPVPDRLIGWYEFAIPAGRMLEGFDRLRRWGFGVRVFRKPELGTAATRPNFDFAGAGITAADVARIDAVIAAMLFAETADGETVGPICDLAIGLADDRSVIAIIDSYPGAIADADRIPVPQAQSVIIPLVAALHLLGSGHATLYPVGPSERLNRRRVERGRKPILPAHRMLFHAPQPTDATTNQAEDRP